MGRATEALERESRPSELGPYRVLDVLGQGGMGVVYKAEHTQTGAMVAIKTVVQSNPRTLMAIRTEVAALRAVHHPGVIEIFEDGLEQGLPWYAMELLEGRTLGDFNEELWRAARPPDSPSGTVSTATGISRVQDSTVSGLVATADTGDLSPARSTIATPSGPLAAGAGRLTEVATLYRLLCAPLGYIHARGMVHRDLKPGNVFIRGDGTPVLMDFGLMSFARGAIGREALGVGSRVVGTLRYVAPEQISGRFVDARVDLYALGCMLYESVTGQPPFSGEKSSQILDAHLRTPPLRPSRVVEGVPQILDDLILVLLSKQPQDRIGHADDVANVLLQVAEGPAAHAVIVESENRSYLYRPQLGGREKILDELLGYVGQLSNADGGLVLVGGESGIGKTFFVSEFGQRASQQRVQVVTGECVGALTGESTLAEVASGPLQPFRRFLQLVADQCREKGPEAVRRLLGSRAPLLAQYEPALDAFVSGEGPPEALPTQAARDRVLGCMQETLAAFVEENGPLVFILDDLQWVDDLSLALLSSLRPAFFSKSAVLFVGTYRTEESLAWLKQLMDGPVAVVTKRLSLERLDRSTIGKIVGEMLAIASPPVALVEFLARASEGNPFFVAEYLRLLVAEGVLSRRDGRWILAGGVFNDSAVQALPAPQSLQEIINQRLGGLSASALAVVEAGAVLGREFDDRLLGEMIRSDLEDATSPLREAVSRQVLEKTEADSYRFSHDKLREACYQQMAPDLRKRLHAKAAEAIENRLAASAEVSDTFATLARHFKQAGNQQKALEYIERAGNEALIKSANREAAMLFTEALDLAESEGIEVGALKRAQWCRQVGDALLGVGHLGESAGFFRRSVEILGLPAPEPRGWRIGMAVFGQIFRQFLHRLFPSRTLGRERSERLLEAAKAYDRLQQVLYYQGDALLPLLHACIMSLNLAERASPSVELVTAYANAQAVAGLLPANSLAEAYLSRAAETLQKTSDRNSETYLHLMAAIRLTGLAAWPKVYDHLQQGLAIARRVDFHRRSEEILGIIGAAQFLTGDFQGALASAEEQHGSALRGDIQTLCWSLLGRAQALIVKDRLDEADADLKQALSLTPRLGQAEEIWAQSLSAKLWWLRDDADQARQAADRALERILKRPPVAVYCVYAYTVVAEVLLALCEHAPTSPKSDREKSVRAATRAIKAIKQDSARVYHAARPGHLLLEGSRLLLGGKSSQAAGCWRQSLELARKLAMPYDEARAHQALASVATPGETRTEHLARAEQLFGDLGADGDLRRLRSL